MNEADAAELQQLRVLDEWRFVVGLRFEAVAAWDGWEREKSVI